LAYLGVILPMDFNGVWELISMILL